MNDHRTTCDPGRIELFLEQKLSDEEQSVFESHLSSCGDCRQRLETAAASEDIWAELCESLRDDQLPPVGVQSGDSDSTGEDASCSQTTVLNLLAPTDDDRMLGRWGMYEVVGVVGTGGMGVVLKAFDAALNRYVAIKILAPHLGNSGGARKRFSREAQAAAAVVHDNVMEIYGVAETAGLPYLVMPYVRGPSLQRRLDDGGPMALAEILRVGMQAAAGLAAAHAQGLVHRDVKPANILLADGIERVKLTDFGLARAADDASLTKTGVIAGTPQYMSPEQARGEAIDQRSDLFSLGSVLYGMCTGRAPFRAETTFGVLRRITDEEPRPIREINAEIPEWLCQIVAKLMAKRRDDRFQSAAEVAKLLEECLAHVQQPMVVPLPAFSLLPMGEGQGVRAVAHSHRPRKPLVKGTFAMLTLIGISLFAVGVVSTNPPDISGNWQGEGWGQLVLAQTAPGQYTGTYTDTVAKEKEPGKIDLKWSRIERRFNGTWREGDDDRFGDLSVRLVDQEIRGALTTNAKSKINPATPRLSDLTWTRAGPSPAPHAHALHLDHGHVDLGSKQLTTGATSVSVWYHYDEHTDQFPILLDLKAGSLSAMFVALNTTGDPGGGRQTVTFGNRGDVVRINAFQTTPYTPTAWTHLVCTYDGSDPYNVRSYSIYVNGRSLALSPTVYHGGTTIENNLGYDSYSLGVGGTPKFFIGSLDELLVYDTVLAAGDVEVLYGGRQRISDEPYPRAGNLVAGYRFDEGRGTMVRDFTGHGNDGTLHGNVKWVAGMTTPKTPPHAAGISHALEFDGNGGTYVDVANPTGLPTGMSARTMSVWFKLDNADEKRVPEIVGYGPNADGRRFGLCLDCAGLCPEGDRVVAEAVNVDASGRWTRDTNWHHLAAVVPEQCTRINQVALYLDGARLRTTNHAGAQQPVATDGFESFDTGIGPLKIGGIPTWDFLQAFKGVVSDVRIYDRALSPAEIAVLHANPAGATNRGLVAGYHFDEGRGTTVHDFSGHGNDGTLHGDVKWVAGTSASAGALQWSEANGGNGHWYQAVLVPEGITWGQAKAAAEARGGYLATIEDSAENDFVFSLINTPPYWTGRSIRGDILGPWLGGYSNKPGTWKWVTGEPFNYAPWEPGQPDAYGGPVQALLYSAGANIGSTWADASRTGTEGYSLPRGYVIEFNTIPEPSSPRARHALEFDGKGGSFVDVPNPTGLPTGMSPRTMSVWFKSANAFKEVRPGEGILGYGPNSPGRRFGLSLDEDLTWADLCGNRASGPWTPDANWHHLAAVVPEQCTRMSQVLVYLDGARMVATTEFNVGTPLRKSRPFQAGARTPRVLRDWSGTLEVGAPPVATDGSESFNTGSGPLKIGGLPAWDYDQSFNGALSEVRIYNRALSPKEIAVLHADPARATNRGLVAGYHLDDGFGEVVHDFSGHGNDGTLHGGVKWVHGTISQIHYQIWDVSNDFSIAKGNPNGTWTYGMVYKSAFVPYTKKTDDGQNRLWIGDLAGDRSPELGIKYGPPANGAQSGQFFLHPGPHGEASVARWTAPAGFDSKVRVQGQFLPGDYGIMQVGIFVNGTPQVTTPYWTSSDSGAFSFSVSVSAGNTIDFAVYGGYIAGATPLSATVTATPGAKNEGASGGSAHALCFDGRNGSYVSIPNMDMNRLTFATWVKRDAIGKKQCMIMSARHGGWGVYFSEKPEIANAWGEHQSEMRNHVWFTRLDVDGRRSEAEIADRKWHFVAVTLDGNALKFYVNGKPAGTISTGFAIDGGGGNYWLGGAAGSGDPGPKFLQGCLRETLIFNRALGPAEIAKLYNLGRCAQPVGKMDGLVAGYHFDEGQGTTVHDFSGHGNDGTLHGGVTWAPGDVAGPESPLRAAGIVNALEFDGNGRSYVDVANPTGLPTGMGARTMSVWFKLANAGEDLYQTILGYGPNLPNRRVVLCLNGDQIGAAGLGEGELAFGRWTRDTKWHHLAAVVPEQCANMKQVLIYLDGARLATMGGSGRIFWPGDAHLQAFTARLAAVGSSQPFDTASGPLKIGGIPTVDWEQAFKGVVGDVRIYDRALSPAEIAVLHANPAGATNRGLVAGYKFDEGRGTTVHDFSGHGNDGTLHGGVKWVHGTIPQGAISPPTKRENVPGAVNPQQAPALPINHTAAAADRTFAAGLIRKLYLSRAWIGESRSFRIRSDYKVTPTAAALQRQDKLGTTEFAYSFNVYGKPDPRPSCVNDEWAWDGSHILYRTQYHYEGDAELNRQTKVWDGSLAVACDEDPQSKQYAFGNKVSQFFDHIANLALFPWGPNDGYHLWWSPVDVAKLHEDRYIAPDDFELAGQEEVQGRRCHVLQSRAGFLRVYVGAEDGRLYRREILLASEKDAVSLAIAQKIGGPSIKTLSDWWTWLKNRKPHEFNLALRRFKEAEFGSARVWLRQTFEDYREVAPGCWLSFRQGIDMYETDASKPFLSSHAEQIVVDVAVNKPLPQDLFRLELAEGVAVVNDWRYDPPISYTYRKNQTEAQRVALCDAQRAKQAKFRDSWKKPEASP